MALNQEDIDVGAAPNDGQGDPIRTAFIKCNDNFTQLYSLPNPTPPATLIGVAGDMPGMYAYDDTYFYYCYAAYNGVSTIWGQLIQSDEAISSIGNGLSNVVIALANANVTVGVAGTGNVGVFSPSGLTVRGIVNSNTIATGSLVSGNFTIAGDTISSLGEMITITPAGNVIFNDVVVDSSLTILGPRTTTESKVLVLANTAANLAVANLSGIQVGSANYSSFLYNVGNSHWTTTESINAYGYHVNGGNVNGANFIRANTVTANVYEGLQHYGIQFFGNTFVGNLFTGNLFTGNLFTGSGAGLTDINGSNITGTVANASYSLQSNNSTFAGTVTINAQPNITTVGTLTSLSVSGTANLSNTNVVGTLQATDVLVQNNVVANGSVTAPAIGTALSTVLNGVIGVTSNSQPNITVLGNITNLFAGNINAADDVYVNGVLYAANIIGNIGGTVTSAITVSANYQPNITQVGTLTGLNVTNEINVTTGGVQALSGNIRGNAVFAPLIGNLGTLFRGTFNTNSNAQPNITSVGNLISVNVTNSAIFGTPPANATTISGNTISSGGTNTLNIGHNVIIPGNLTVQGTTITVNSNTVTINDLFINVANNAATASQANGGGIGVGPVGSEYASLFYVAVTDSWNMDAPLNVAGNISAPSFNWSNGSPLVSPSGALSVSNITASGNVTSTANINAAGATFSGNVTAAFFNGTATSAQYADLAENYLADLPYQPGTVVSFGGDKEVTVSAVDLDPLVAGVISTNPAYTMNSGLTGNYTTPVALMGRVPCRVTGTVARGAMMVSNGDGTARAEVNPIMGSVIGKALESFDGVTGVIEIVVGKL
jgi:hypothetical protein